MWSVEAGIAGAADRPQAEPGGEDDQGDPEQVGAEEVNDLQPDWRKQRNVSHSQCVLKKKQADDSDGKPAIDRSREPSEDNPENEGPGNEADDRMQPANV